MVCLVFIVVCFNTQNNSGSSWVITINVIGDRDKDIKMDKERDKKDIERVKEVEKNIKDREIMLKNTDI